MVKKIREFVAGGGYMFSMCSAPDSFDVALAADRELTFDEHGLAQVVSWETEPPDTTKFKLAGPALERKRPLLRRPGGLYMMRSMMMIIVR